MRYLCFFLSLLFSAAAWGNMLVLSRQVPPQLEEQREKWQYLQVVQMLKKHLKTHQVTSHELPKAESNAEVEKILGANPACQIRH